MVVSCRENGNDRRLLYPGYITKESKDGGMTMRDFYFSFSTTSKIHAPLVKVKETRKNPCANFFFVMVVQETVFFWL